jgi:hypothetical protein
VVAPKEDAKVPNAHLAILTITGADWAVKYTSAPASDARQSSPLLVRKP